jgi:exopolysaccharide biosynthesis polyprenyl glycosylphosphotransferase
MAQLPNIKRNITLASLLGLRVPTAPPAIHSAIAAPAHAPADAIAIPRATRQTRRAGLGLGERKFMQGLCDWMVVMGGALIILTLSERNYQPMSMGVSLGIITVLWFFFADAFDAYKIPVMQSSFRSSYTAVKVLLMTIVAFTLISWFSGGFLPVIRPRISETFQAFLLSIPLVLARGAVSALLTRAPLRRKVVVIGANRDGYEMGDALARYDGKTYEFLGYFDDARDLHTLLEWTIDSKKSEGSKQKVGDSHVSRITYHEHSALVWPTSELLPIHSSRGLDQVVLANPTQTPQLLQTLSLLHEQGVQITPMFALYQDLTGRVPVSHLGNDWYVALPAHVKNNSRTYMGVKRAWDFGMALFALALTAPLIPLIALAIKLDSPGPAFFKQMRVGKGGKVFKIVKFRTMRHNAEANTGAVWATNRDPRITRIGRFLRKSRLDEIPQLWNVVVGDMSFVGPRPERPEFDEELEREIPFYRARRAVRPGLTGWAQVSHGYGNTMLDALRKVEYDLYYIKNESLYLDLMILLRTVAVVLKLGGT